MVNAKLYSSPGLAAIREEHRRQVWHHGFDPGSEKSLRGRVLAEAALCYLDDGARGKVPRRWPLPQRHWHPAEDPGDPVQRCRSLACAGALLLAEHQRVNPWNEADRGVLVEHAFAYTLDGFRQCVHDGPLRDRIAEEKLIRASRAYIEAWTKHQNTSQVLLDAIANVAILMDVVSGEPVFDNQ